MKFFRSRGRQRELDPTPLQVKAKDMEITRLVDQAAELSAALHQVVTDLASTLRGERRNGNDGTDASPPGK